MKEISIIIISIIIVLVGSNISRRYIENSSAELINDLDNLKIEIEKAQDSIENNSEDLSNDIYNKWKDLEEKWSMIVIHSELDSIQLSLISMKTYINEKEYDEGMEELEKVRYLINHIQDREKLLLKNII